MKKILFAAHDLGLGGIETALVALINYLADIKQENGYKYEITLVLEKKQGIFLKNLNSRIKIIEYTPNTNKIKGVRKLANMCKRIRFASKYKNKFDFSAAYATYSLPASFVARTASKNSALWCHMDYVEQYQNDIEKVKEFFKEKKYKEFRNIIFVSEQGKKTFEKVFPEMKNVYAINNIIDYKNIIKKSQESVKEEINKNNTIFLNVGRHDEEQKKLSRIIEACNKLKKEGLKFKIIFVGDGKNNEEYKKMIKNYKLEKHIIFLGKKENPYPYFKVADCILLSSDYEGYPVVFTEAMVLNKPIITTNVSGSDNIKGKYGFVIEKNTEQLYEKMKEFILNGYEIKKQFNPEEYNKEIKEKLEEIIG